MAVVGPASGKLAVLDAGKAAAASWWAWIGGTIGAAVIIARPIAAPWLGAAAFIGILVTSSVCASVALDHFGLVGFPEHAASWGRIARAALMVAGVWLVATF